MFFIDQITGENFTGKIVDKYRGVNIYNIDPNGVTTATNEDADQETLQAIAVDFYIVELPDGTIKHTLCSNVANEIAIPVE